MILSDAQVTQALADILKVALGSLPSYYTSTLVSQGHVAGYQTVLGALLKRGFTLAQVLAADRLAEWEMDQSLYHILTRAGAYKAVAPETLKVLNRAGSGDSGPDKSELAQCVLFVAGVPVVPADASTATQLVGFGTVNSDPDDLDAPWDVSTSSVSPDSTNWPQRLP